MSLEVTTNKKADCKSKHYKNSKNEKNLVIPNKKVKQKFVELINICWIGQKLSKKSKNFMIDKIF